MRKILIFGASGSIGQSTVKLIQANRDKFTIVGASAGARFSDLEKAAPALNIKHILNTKNGADIGSITTFIQQCQPDIVLNAVSGFEGLPYTLATLQLEIPLALANKESLVAAGDLVMKLARERRAPIYPVDSEHSAIWQCLANDDQSLKDFSKIYLTCSGGPFFGETDLSQVTKAQALKHPNWDMGAAITIDSATLANKCLEFFEAMHLFSASPKQIEIVVHPQSVVHSMVQFADSSIVAQLSPPSMELPIAYALNYPNRENYKLETPDFTQLDLSFRAPDKNTFKTLAVMEHCAKEMKNLPTVFNAANEVARNAFIDGDITFSRIFEIIEAVVDKTTIKTDQNLADIYQTDKQARVAAQALL
ncbi:1-deoxy-D-xylulose-5-phosphate reductoisomerase [bacterium]|nr:1-deoxy-D-xylulose-5-phosphate reductoisomerase [bacterium]NCQ55426.1 1-deoxy-D-xylulose-5-phosphate reductoisomerase [Candidatus Parcubacteria bacterium]NCS67788.1 1-deoxy-D-xylulose-5-phosphate reductoisomerase [Candidatus Peregrinibacteria bacterium]NCS96398.1 1-deoxy-D-xylulose-5-phosphate reductoisomerase [bacterium]